MRLPGNDSTGRADHLAGRLRRPTSLGRSALMSQRKRVRGVHGCQRPRVLKPVLLSHRDGFLAQGIAGDPVILMKGDWTNRDPAITKVLAACGRAGVPLYVVYNSKPGSTEPLVLPQLLTAGAVQSAFGLTQTMHRGGPLNNLSVRKLRSATPWSATHAAH